MIKSLLFHYRFPTLVCTHQHSITLTPSINFSTNNSVYVQKTQKNGVNSQKQHSTIVDGTYKQLLT